MLSSGLYIIATPIGNMGDISARAMEILQHVPVVACEDTRVTKKLFSLLGLSLNKTFISYQDHNEEDKAQAIVSLIQEGQPLALVSDAGSPLISDPGYKLVRQCRLQNVPVYTVPGASAVICALQLSGLPTNRFMFAGFIPNKDKARLDLFRELKDINTTLVFYETAPRLCKTLTAAAEVFQGREIAVAREITKVYEECRNGMAEELLAYYTENPPKGEIVMMVAPPTESAETEFDLKGELEKRLPLLSLKSAVKEVCELTGAAKNDVYALALELKNEQL